MSKDLVFEIKENRVLYVNTSLCSLLGYSRNEMVGLPTEAWLANLSIKEIADLDKVPFDAFWKEEILCLRDKNERLWKTNFRIAKGESSETVICIGNLILQDSLGEQLAFQEAYREADERKKVESLYIKANREIDNFFFVSREFLCVIDEDFRFQVMNPSFVEAIGISADELLVNTLLDYLHEEDKPIFISKMAKSKKVEGSTSFEIRCKTKSSSFSIFRWTIYFDSESSFYYCSAIDFTQEHSLQRELGQTLGAIHRSAIVAVTDRYGTILEVNDLFSEISGYEKEELIGKNHRILNSGYHPPSFFKQMWNSILAGNNWTGEIKNKRKNGEYYWVQTVISPMFDDSGNVDRFIAIRIDITEQKSIETRWVQSSKMASLGEMASGIAHEINNPLTIIQGKVGQLKRATEKDKFNRERYLEELEKIKTTVDRIDKIIKSLKSFSRDSSHDPLHRIDLREIIQDASEICRDRCLTSGVELRLGDIPDRKIDCRPSQIIQILINLVNNAIDAIEDLESPWVEISYWEDLEYSYLSITDSGKGIPKEVVNKMMQPFFTTKGIGKGTGLGLSISKTIMQSHGGDLVYNDSRANTCFDLIFPKREVNN